MSKTLTFYRVRKSLRRPGSPPDFVSCLGYVPARRPAWQWRHSSPAPCSVDGRSGPPFTLFRELEDLKNGLRSRAVKAYSDPDVSPVYGTYYVELLEVTYVYKTPDCYGEHPWVLESEKVIRQIYPNPTVLDKLAAI